MADAESTAMSELQTQAYATDFFDVRSLNEHISAQLEARIDDVQRDALHGQTSPSRAMVVLGAAGGGKTHLFARLRRHCGPHATLVLLRPYFGAVLTPRHVLTACIDHICAGPTGDTDIAASQLALVAAHWLADEQTRAYPAMVLDDLAQDDASERSARITRGITSVLAQLPRSMAAAHIVQSLLTVAGTSPPPYEMLAWLAGRDQGSDQAPLSEADVMQTLQILAVMAAPVAPLVIVFDQLENLASSDGTRVVAYGSVVSELIDVVPNLTIVQLALTSEWRQFIEPNLSLPHRTRVATNVTHLATPSREQRLALLAAWHEQAFDGQQRPEFPTPLSAQQLDDLLDAPGMTPRLLMVALQHARDGHTQAPHLLATDRSELASAGPSSATTATTSTASTLRQHQHANNAAMAVTQQSPWARECERAATKLRRLTRAQQPVDAIEVAEALAAGLSYLPHTSVDILTERATLQVVVTGAGHVVRFIIINGLHHSSATAALAKATELAAIDKVVLVRETRCPLPASWEAIADRRAAFERLANARWLWISDDDMRNILALSSAHSLVRAKRWEAADGARLTETDLRSVLRQEARPTSWSAISHAERCMADVPHAPEPAQRHRKTSKREVTRELAPVPTAPTPTLPVTSPVLQSTNVSSPLLPNSSVPALAAPQNLRQWLATGRELARGTFAAYRAKIVDARRKK